MCGSECINRYDFALKVADALNLSTDLIEKAEMKDMTRWVAKRPRDSSLDFSRAKKLLKTKFYDTSLAMEIFQVSGGKFLRGKFKCRF